MLNMLINSTGTRSSYAHVNPAITIAFASFGHFPWSKVYNFGFWMCTMCSSVGTKIEVVPFCVTV